MKKIIITTVAVISASLGFYISESGSLSHVGKNADKAISYETMLDLGAASGHRLDIAQADIN